MNFQAFNSIGPVENFHKNISRRNQYIDKFAEPLIIQRTAKKQLTSDWSNMSNGRIENDTGLEQQVMCQRKMRKKSLPFRISEFTDFETSVKMLFRESRSWKTCGFYSVQAIFDRYQSNRIKMRF